MKKSLPYIHTLIGRDGAPRHYLRKKGLPRLRIQGVIGTREFNENYFKAVSSLENLPELERAPKKATIKEAIAIYKAVKFPTFAKYTIGSTSRLLRRIEEAYGEIGLKDFTRANLSQALSDYADKPDTGNRLLSLLSQLFEIGIERGYIEQNPAVHVKKLNTKVIGYYSWAESDISLFEQCFATGTKERLALYLLLYTAQRRGDVVKMGFSCVYNGNIGVKQNKTGNELFIPILDDLKNELDFCDTKKQTFLVTSFGKPFTPEGFYNWFKEACRKAQVDARCSPHGLRKAAATRLANAGASVHEIMSITGHKSIKEVMVYTLKAEQLKLAKQASGFLNKSTKM